MHSMRDAASFLTRVPLHRSSVEGPNMGAAVPWFAAVGAVLGAVQGGIYVGLAEVSTRPLAAAMSVAITALITGAFHHDGLADMADGFGGGWTVEQRLEIMKDSRLGTYGATALFCVIAIEVMALASIGAWVAFAATIVAHALSRAVATGVMIIATPARAGGLGVDYLRDLSQPAVGSALLVTLAGTGALFGLGAIAVAAAAGASAALVVKLAKSKIGGITGDVLGAVQQIAKIVILIVVVVLHEASDPTTLDTFGGLVL